MKKKDESRNLHQKMEVLIQEMVEKDLDLKDALREFEKIYIEITSKKYQANITRMSKALGIHRNTLHNRIKTLKIK